MKLAIILILSAIVIILGLSVTALRKELLNSNNQARLLEERNERLHNELMRLGSINRANEQFLSELETAVSELEERIPLETMEKHIPKDILKDARPVIERLRFLRETRGEDARENITDRR